MEEGIPLDEIEKTAGWADDMEGLREQFIRVALDSHCTHEDVLASIYPCAYAVAQAVGGKLPASLDFVSGA